ncbi:MAG: Hsp20/alpha crystallin family protein [Acidobacteriota bacterium]
MTNKHDLLQKFLTIQERMHSILDETTSGSGDPSCSTALSSSWSPEVDIYETEDSFVLTAEVPGLNRDQIDIQIQDQILCLKGHRQVSSEPTKQTYHRLERPSGRFERRFMLPDEVDQEQVHATMTLGVLNITLPKKSRSFRVKVTSS